MNNNSRSSNGRVDILTSNKASAEAPDISNLFAMYDKIPANQCTTLREPTLGQWDDTPLSNSYFSKQNIQIIQNGIRAGVYDKSNGQYVIGYQDCDALKVIMRSVFLQHAANQPKNVQGQIEQLNQIVLDYCIPYLYNESIAYVKYLEDQSTLVVPLAREVRPDRNYNQLELKPWI